MSVGALAYDTVPLASVGKLDMFSPGIPIDGHRQGSAWSCTCCAGWRATRSIDTTMRTFFQQVCGQSRRLQQTFSQSPRHDYGEQSALVLFAMAGFHRRAGIQGQVHRFTGWATTRASASSAQMQQDLDLFRMPIELKIDTDGKTETKRIEVVGTDSPSLSRTSGRPRRIVD